MSQFDFEFITETERDPANPATFQVVKHTQRGTTDEHGFTYKERKVWKSAPPSKWRTSDTVNEVEITAEADGSFSFYVGLDQEDRDDSVSAGLDVPREAAFALHAYLSKELYGDGDQ